MKLASAHYLDDMPASGDELGRAFRDRELEQQIFDLSTRIGIGAQFGGKYFAHDVRVIRLPRHGASCPVGLGVSCSADRQALGKITRHGIFLEQVETNPARFLPEVTEGDLGMEAIWKIQVVDIPAFVIINHEGRDFYTELPGGKSGGLISLKS